MGSRAIQGQATKSNELLRDTRFLSSDAETTQRGIWKTCVPYSARWRDRLRFFLET